MAAEVPQGELALRLHGEQGPVQGVQLSGTRSQCEELALEVGEFPPARVVLGAQGRVLRVWDAPGADTGRLCHRGPEESVCVCI